MIYLLIGANDYPQKNLAQTNIHAAVFFRQRNDKRKENTHAAVIFC